MPNIYKKEISWLAGDPLASIMLLCMCLRLHHNIWDGIGLKARGPRLPANRRAEAPATLSAFRKYLISPPNTPSLKPCRSCARAWTGFSCSHHAGHWGSSQHLQDVVQDGWFGASTTLPSTWTMPLRLLGCGVRVSDVENVLATPECMRDP